ncbi:unnamed protein product [Ilex paraguariensis]|uniref:Uncharacterized protein n=1 Tax=Ilex paraguariensis TaxID=185542 RepID=A0ABC8QUJ9_9AQUA
MTGAYRRVFQKPKDYDWELLTYTDGSIQLAQTDMDIIAKSRSATMAREGGAANRNEEEILPVSCEAGSLENNTILSAENNEAKCKREVGSHRALKLGFTLPASCYATMAIRELLKISTSCTCRLAHVTKENTKKLVAYELGMAMRLLTGCRC